MTPEIMRQYLAAHAPELEGSSRLRRIRPITFRASGKSYPLRSPRR